MLEIFTSLVNSILANVIADRISKFLDGKIPVSKKPNRKNPDR